MKRVPDVDRNVTLRDVAKAAGVGLATASRALRDDTSAAPATREKVKRAARDMGYRPDPSLHSLIERRWRGRRRNGDLNLGYLYDSRSLFAGMAAQQYQRFKALAEERSYSLLGEDLAGFHSIRDLMRRLEAQGISGLLVSLLTETAFPLETLFANYPAVSVNVSHYQPDCPIVMHDEYASIGVIWAQLAQLGYERIGAMLKAYPDSITVQQRLGAILCQQRLCRQARNRIPLFSFSNLEQNERDKLRRWLDRYQPDVVLGNAYRDLLVLQELGYRIPEDFSFAVMNLWETHLVGEVAGYRRDNAIVLERSLHLLNMMIRTGSAGNRHSSLMELVKGEWEPGKTLPQRKTNA